MTVNSKAGNVALKIKEAVAYIEIQRERRHNAIDIETAKSLLDRCREIDHNDLVRAVVVFGQGASFGVGGDLTELKVDPPRTARKIIGPLHEAVSILVGLDAPVIAKVRGNVAGGSMSLSLACDLVVASVNTKFNFAYTNLGTTADLGGSWHLPHIVGLRKAMQIALLNDTIDAERARDLGIVNHVVADEELDDHVDRLAERLASGPTRAFGRMKRQLRQALGTGLHGQLNAEVTSFVQSARTHDFSEAVDAILAKRTPRFIGA
jgi:2-(1,2-epoxy-1,2-dihydrophenyl)acetyl-CoA isomerase